MTLLPQSFYARDALIVARDLLGKEIKKGQVTLRISEVEAYRWPGDSANHCRSGHTKRNAPMWGPPGHAYVYLCYGVHHLLNFVTNHEGEGAAVLIRSCELVRGLVAVQRRRGNQRGPAMLNGPGKLSSALAIDSSWSSHTLYLEKGLEVHDAPRVGMYLKGPRVGIDYASAQDIKAPWRLALPNTPWVSQRSSLKAASKQKDD
jgi:DNA-3-methyladenine glycosylase